MSPSTGILPNTTVTFTVTIDTGSDLTGIVAEDIFAGRARSDEAYLVGDACSTRGRPMNEPFLRELYIDQLNRVIYKFDLGGSLTRGCTTWSTGAARQLSCFRASNEIHLDQPAGRPPTCLAARRPSFSQSGATPARPLRR